MTVKTAKCKRYGITDVMEKFHLYQSLQYFILCFPTAFVTMININYIFVAREVDYRCYIPECESQSPTFQAEWWPDGAVDRCMRPVLVSPGVTNQTCSNASFSGEMVPCTQWVYENDNSVIAHLNLGCNPWAISLIGTVHNAGMLVAMVLAGLISDRFGRKPAVIFTSVIGVIGHFKTLTTNYYVYLVIELLESLSGGTYAAIMVLMIETGGKRMRLMAGVIFAYAIYVGEAAFAVIAMYVAYWKTLISIIYLPCILFLGCVFILKESPRWLVLNGKTQQALDSLKQAAKMNKLQIDEDDFNADEAKLKKAFDINENEPKEGFKELFTSIEILKRVIVGCVAKFTASFVYYGLMINSVFLPGDMYTNFLLATIMSFPGELVALYVMNRFGRKVPLIIGYLISGALCVGSAYVPEEYTWAKITLFLCGKMVISVCFTGAVTYTMELFPTSARGLLLGVCSQAAQLGSMLAPMTPILAEVSPVLPSIFFGGFAVLSSLLLTINPETKNLPLLNTVAQVNASVKEAKEKKKQKKAEDAKKAESNGV